MLPEMGKTFSINAGSEPAWEATMMSGMSDQAGCIATASWKVSSAFGSNASSTTTMQPTPARTCAAASITEGHSCASMPSLRRKPAANARSAELGETTTTFTGGASLVVDGLGPAEEARHAGHHTLEVDQRRPDGDAVGREADLADGVLVAAAALLQQRQRLLH